MDDRVNDGLTVPLEVAKEDFAETMLLKDILQAVVEYRPYDSVLIADAAKAFVKIQNARFRSHAPKYIIADMAKVLLMFFAYGDIEKFLPRLAFYCGLKEEEVSFDEKFMNCNNAFAIAVRRKKEKSENGKES